MGARIPAGSGRPVRGTAVSVASAASVPRVGGGVGVRPGSRHAQEAPPLSTPA